ncbi:MAG: hypothetical protein HYX75_21535 [Acidobacteria bacterium]|nr:hypothetical protein [Acidobacteriota bacterium]
MKDRRCRTSLLVGAAFFLVAGLCRVNNLGSAFQGGVAQIRPFDELYHAKRIIHSASRFPSILEFDPDRGPAGSYCPWPPLYDLAAGGAARMLGGRSAGSVLNRAVWFPPLV